MKGSIAEVTINKESDTGTPPKYPWDAISEVIEDTFQSHMRTRLAINTRTLNERDPAGSRQILSSHDLSELASHKLPDASMRVEVGNFPKEVRLPDSTAESGSSSTTPSDGQPLWNRSEVPKDRGEEFLTNIKGITTIRRHDEVHLAEILHFGNQKENTLRKLEIQQETYDSKPNNILDLLSDTVMTLSSVGFSQGPSDCDSKAGMGGPDGPNSRHKRNRRSTRSRKDPRPESDPSSSGIESDSSENSSSSSSTGSGSDPSSEGRTPGESSLDESSSLTKSDRNRRKFRRSKGHTSRKSTKGTKVQLGSQKLSRASAKSSKSKYSTAHSSIGSLSDPSRFKLPKKYPGRESQSSRFTMSNMLKSVSLLVPEHKRYGHSVSGYIPATKLEFLMKFVAACKGEKVTASDALGLLPHFLKGTALAAIESQSPSSWEEAAAVLLRSGKVGREIAEAQIQSDFSASVRRTISPLRVIS